MSLKQKVKEWKRRIVHLLIIAMVITSVPVVPTWAQESEQSVTGEVTQENVSGGDGNVSGEGVAANAVTSIVPMVKCDIFYSEMNDIVSHLVENVELIFEDGTTQTCVPYDTEWGKFSIGYGLCDAQGNWAGTDADGKYISGDYVLKLYVQEVSCEIPVKVVSVEEIATEIALGQTITGLSGTDNDDGNTGDFEGGHWFKMELTEPGEYQLSKSKNGSFFIWYPDGSIHSNMPVSFNMRIQVIGDGGTYYCYTKGTDEFDITLSKKPMITEIIPNLITDIVYYEVGTIDINQMLESVELTCDDESKVVCYMWDDVWNGYFLNYSLHDSTGEIAQLDENGKYLPGEYTYKIYQENRNIYCEFPVHVISIEDESIDIGVGDSVTGLSSSSDYTSCNYMNGHWIKMDLINLGSYTLSANCQTGFTLMCPDGNSSYDISNRIKIHAEQAGMYYCYVKPSDELILTLTKTPSITSITPITARNTFYYEMENWQMTDVISSVNIGVEDGTIESCSLWDATWNLYELNYNIYDTNGDLVQLDENGKYPVGSYSCKIATPNDALTCEVGVNVVSVESLATELVPSETVSGLSGTDNYESSDYTGGHWFKIELDGQKRYELAKSEPGYLMIRYSDGTGESYSNSNSSIVQGNGTCYCYVKGSNDFEVTLTELPSVTAITPVVKRNEFYYEVESVDIYDIIEEVQITFEDGTVKNCTPWDTVWGAQNMWNGLMTDTEWNFASTDENGKYPIGEYTCRISTGSGVFCDIPITVVSLENVAIELAVGETISGLTGTDTADDLELVGGHWLKVEFEEQGRYILSMSEYGNAMIFFANDGPVVHSGNEINIDVTPLVVGTTYIYINANEVFDIVFSKIPTVTVVTPIVGRDSFYYEVDSINTSSVIRAVDLEFDDGTKKTCQMWDETWYLYGMNCGLYDTEGNWAQYDENCKYAIGDYVVKLDVFSCGRISCEIPIRVLALVDIENEFEINKEIDFTEAINTGWYNLTVPETGLYDLEVMGDVSGNGYIMIYDENLYPSRSYFLGDNSRIHVNILEQGNYYMGFECSGLQTQNASLRLSAKEPINEIIYSGEDIVLNYGEWGYSITGDISGNVSTKPLQPNSAVSGNNLLKLPISIEATMTDGTVESIPFRGGYNTTWQEYFCAEQLTNLDGSKIQLDRNGYLPNGDYKLLITAYKDASLEIPVKVVGGPLELSAISYTGDVQKFEYGTWGYSVKTSVSGNQIVNNSGLLSGNYLINIGTTNVELNRYFSNNNVAMNIEFSLNGEDVAGNTELINYGDARWDIYIDKISFQDTEGNLVYTDGRGYIPVGSYIMKCTAYNGLVCDVPLKVYDPQAVAEGKIEVAVGEILDAAENLKDGSLLQATTEKKIEAVTGLLQTVEKTYEQQNIAGIGVAAAEKAIEFVEKLEEIEEQIKELLNTSVTTNATDQNVEEMGLTVKNALLSVPAGENAEIKVSTAEVPTNMPVAGQSVAIQLELRSEQQEQKLQLQAPVVLTMRIPSTLNANREIVAFHYKDGEESHAEIIPVSLNADEGIMSFVTGSFSTFVFVNVEEEESIDIGAILGGYTITLDGNIGVNYFMELSDSIMEDSTAHMQFTLPNGLITQVNVADARKDTTTVAGKTYYVFSCEVAAKEMTADIKAQFIAASGVSEEYVYCVEDYAKQILTGSSYTQNAKDTVKAMLNYGAYSQIHFGYNPQKLANASLQSEDVVLDKTAISDEFNKLTKTGTAPKGITFLGNTVILETNTLIRYYFDVEEGTDVSGYGLLPITPATDNGNANYYYETAGIAAKDWAAAHELQVGDYKITYSPLTYAYLVTSNNEYSDVAKNVCYAMYKYYQEANKYFATK